MLPEASKIHQISPAATILDEKCMLRVLANLDFHDLLSLRVVAKRFCRIILENPAALQLAPPNRLSLVGSKSAGRCLPYSGALLQWHRDPIEVDLPFGLVHRPLRLRPFHSVSLHYLDISGQLLRQISIGNASGRWIGSVEIANCRISVSLAQIADFLCLHRTVHFVVKNTRGFSGHFAAGNWTELLAKNPQLEVVDLHFGGDKPKNLAISDRTLAELCRWPQLPKMFILRNVRTQITASGISALVQHFLRFAQSNGEQHLMDIGHFPPFCGAAELLLEALAPFRLHLCKFHSIGPSMFLTFQKKSPPNAGATKLHLKFAWSSR